MRTRMRISRERFVCRELTILRLALRCFAVKTIFSAKD